MSDYDAIKASEGPNAEAWAEIGAFIIAGREPEPEPEPEVLEEINNDGEVDALDDDHLPEGYQQCDGCGAIGIEDDMIVATYGYLCEFCEGDDPWDGD